MDQEKKRLLKNINSDCYGGSENQFRMLLKYLPDESFKDINLILNNTNPDLIKKGKINILWMHHFVNQADVKYIGSKEYLSQLDLIVFNSNWNFEKFGYQFKVPESKSIVIRNAIEKIKFKEKPKDKISLIYHTTPWRGLKHLLNVFKKLNRNDTELNVCSSIIIYGKKFNNIYGKKYEKIFEECKNTKNVNYYGYIENYKVLELLQKVHIFSYPSTWPETSCIAAVEAMAAGCQIVSTNLGAMYETCSPFGKLISFDRNFEKLEKNFLEQLLLSIENFWSEENQKKLKLQSESINLLYSWENRSREWIKLFEDIRKLKG